MSDAPKNLPPLTKATAGPCEVWLSLSDAGFGVRCGVVFEDETDITLDVDALSIRGAEREMTAWLIGKSYKAVGRWATEAADQHGSDLEVSRKFAPASEEAQPLR